MGIGLGINRRYNYDKIAEYLKQCKNVKQTAEKFNCNKSTVSEIGKLYNISIPNNGTQIMHNKYGITINQYDKNNNYIRSFNSIRDAGKWCEQQGAGLGAASNINKCLKGKMKTAYGYLWKQN